MLHSTMILNPVETTMMIGKKETFLAYYLACTSAIEENNSVFHTTMIDRINIIDSDIHTHLLHLFLVVLQQHRNPHSLVGFYL